MHPIRNTIAIAVLAAMAPASATEEQDIHQLCQIKPEQCLIDIVPYLAATQKQSRIWYQYKLHQFQALFQLNKYAELAQATRPWVENDTVPLKFRINVLIYYAKSIRKQDELDPRQYMRQAVALLDEVKDSAFDPLLIVQIANVLNYLGEDQRGYELLKPLAEKYQNRYMPWFRHEMYENLGHFALKLGKLDEHIDYRIKALDWAKELGNDNQTAIATFNLARAYQMVDKFDLALVYFTLAEEFYALGEIDQNMINFRRAQIALAQNDIDSAEVYFSKVNKNSRFTAYTDMFDVFKERLTAAKLAANTMN